MCEVGAFSREMSQLSKIHPPPFEEKLKFIAHGHFLEITVLKSVCAGVGLGLGVTLVHVLLYGAYMTSSLSRLACAGDCDKAKVRS